MTVKIPITTPVSEPRLYRGYQDTQAWRNFCISRMTPFEDVLHEDMIQEALKEYDALWLCSEGQIEFASQEQAVLWVLRWS